MFLISDSIILIHFFSVIWNVSISASQDSFSGKWLSLTDVSEKLYIGTHKTENTKE